MTPQTKTRVRHFATPLVIGSYLVTGISGVMLFFHLAESTIKEAHEWIGILFVLGAVIHMATHWTPTKQYFGKNGPRIIMLATLIGASVFVSEGLTKTGGNPIRSVLNSVETAPLTMLAQLQQRPVTELVKQLGEAGLHDIDASTNIKTIAISHSASPKRVMAIIFQQGTEGAVGHPDQG